MSAPKVRGLAAINRAFKKAPDVVQVRLGKANETTAVAIANRARAGVPARYGFLKRHVAHTFSPRTGLARVGIARGTVAVPVRNGSALTKDGAKSATPSKYARLVEWGTSKAKAQPFMGPAVRAEAQPHLERIRRQRAAIEQEIAAAAGGGD